MIGIYCITNPNNKIYIGSSKNINRRWVYYKTLNCKDQPAIYNSLVKYGVDNHKFEIIYECTKEELLDKEQMFLDFYKPELNSNNKVNSGPMTKEWAEKMKTVRKGENNPNWKGGKATAISYQKEYQKLYMRKYRAMIKAGEL